MSPIFGTTASLTLVDPLSSEEVQLFSKDSIKYRISTVSAGETYEGEQLNEAPHSQTHTHAYAYSVRSV